MEDKTGELIHKLDSIDKRLSSIYEMFLKINKRIEHIESDVQEALGQRPPRAKLRPEDEIRFLIKRLTELEKQIKNN